VVAPSLSWHGGWQAAPRFLSFLKIGGALKTILGAGNSIASRLLLQALEREGPDPYALPDTRSPGGLIEVFGMQPFVSPRKKTALTKNP
jgi:hypothetical protein